jgi:hypothetical protein
MKKYAILKADHFGNLNFSQIDEIINKYSYSRELVYSSFQWANYLIYYILLTHLTDDKIDELSSYMSRYYWFKKFYHRYSKSNGIDVGMEQQLVKILEIMGNKIKDFDWDEIKKINDEIEKEQIYC